MRLGLNPTWLIGARLRPSRHRWFALGLPRVALAVVLLAVMVAPAASLAQSSRRRGIHHHHRHHARHPRHHALAVQSTGSASCTTANTAAAAASLDTMRAAVLCLVNQQRQQRGLPRLTLSPALDQSAQEWAAEMVRTGNYAHGDYASRDGAAGYDGQLMGENIATGNPTPAAVVAVWMASADHCENVLNPSFRDVGIGETPSPVGDPALGPATWTLDLGLATLQTAPSSNWLPWRGCPYGG